MVGVVYILGGIYTMDITSIFWMQTSVFFTCYHIGEINVISFTTLSPTRARTSDAESLKAHLISGRSCDYILIDLSH